MPVKPSRYLLLRDKHDPRDLRHVPRAPAPLPPSLDIRSEPWPVWDQGNLESCTAHALCAALQFIVRRQRRDPGFDPSRLFLYYNERAREGTLDRNAPVTMRDGIKAVARNGACREELWPYIETRYADKPDPPCYWKANEHRAVGYAAVTQQRQAMRACLAEGFPFTIGIDLYSSYEGMETKRTGMIPVPDLKRDVFLGGHALLVVGYDSKLGYIVRNSFGPSWGRDGYGWLPFAFAEDSDLAHSLWTLRFAT
ncbi:MAG: C1 family peptidase [Planctomycetaceae bacterium]